MYLYVIYILLLVVAYLELDKFQYFGKVHRLFFFVILLSFWFLSSFRWEMGTDWTPYKIYFDMMSGDFPIKDWYMEPGFSLLNYIVNLIFGSYSMMLAIQALLVYSMMGVTLYRYSVYPIFSIVVWWAMLLGDVFLVRNTLAVALACFSLRYIINREFWKFLVIILIAMTFHRSAIIFLPAYFIFYVRVPRKILVCILAIGLIISLGFGELILKGVGGLLGGAFEVKVKGYLSLGTDEMFGSAYSSVVVLLKGAVNRSLILVVLLIWMNRERYQDDLLNGFINFYSVGLILFFMTVPFSPAMGRIANYYNLFQVFLFPYVLLLAKDRKNQLALYGLMGIYFLVRLHGVVMNYKDLYIPYNSIFDSL